MEVILNHDIPNLGYKNEIVSVKAGYGRNYLIPKKMAKIANESNKKALAELIRQQTKKYEKLKAELDVVAEKLSSSVLTIGTKAGTSGKIFGSVNTLQIADAINKAHGTEIDRRKVSLPEPVKNLGTYTANVELHREIKTTVSFEVVAE